MELKNHWIRLLILISYFVLVFVISRILDLVLWCHHGYLPTDLVDPIVLNVRQLKQVLDSRGISYTGILEKPQLVELLNNSAHLLKSELDELVGTKQNISQQLPPSTHFTGGSHFNEKVEDAKDSVWLVQVLPVSKRKEPLLDDYSWQYLKHQLAPFAIQTGVFDCTLDNGLCERRNWLEPILLLALPRGNRPKDHLIIRTSNTPKIHMIIKWVKEQLSSRVTKINTLQQLEEDWLSVSDKSDNFVKVVLLSHLLHTPLFLAALSIKFSGRINFGMFSVKREDSSGLRKLIAHLPQHTSLPAYLVITPEKTHSYGHWPAEHLNMLHMNLFLKLVVPEINDVFLVSLLLTNMLALIDICQMRYTSHLVFLVVRTLFLLIGYNLTLFSFSLLFYNLSFPFFPLVSLMRYLNFSYLGALMRSDLLFLYAHPVYFAGNFLVYAFLMGKKFPTKDSGLDFFPVGNSFFNFLFRPSEPARFTSDVHFDLRFEQFVVSAPRVSHTPNLWLQTSMPRVNYTSSLPVFVYKGWRPCPHKGMKMICRVMDGEENDVLAVRRDDLGVSSPRSIGTNQPDGCADVNRSSISSNTPSTTHSSLLTDTLSNTQTSSSVRLSSNDASYSRNNATCSRQSECSYASNSQQNITSSTLDVNVSNSASSTTKSFSFSSRLVSRIPNCVRRRSRSKMSSHNFSNLTHSKPSSSLNDSGEAMSSRSSTSESHHDEMSGNSDTRNAINEDTYSRDRPSVEVGHNRGDSSTVNPHECRRSSQHRGQSLGEKISKKQDKKEEAEDCDYLECRLIRCNNCAICLEPYVDGTILLALPCAHHYHKSCILPWLQRVAQCPVCRWHAYDQKYDFSY